MPSSAIFISRTAPAVRAALLVVGWVLAHPSTSAAAAIVLENRTPETVAFRLTGSEGRSLDGQLAPGQLLPISVTGRIAVAYRSGEELRRFAIEPRRAYAFVHADGRLHLAALPLAPDPLNWKIRIGDGKLLGEFPPRTVTVKMLVDDDQPSVRRLWEPKLRRRIETASTIFQRHFNVSLKVVDVDAWDSNDAVTDFNQSLSEFEREVDPGDAMVAVGFTSQYRLPEGKTHLGGTRGPMHPWVLVREWSQHVTESERLEVLVHELGHYLGAAHSPERTSVMRPTMGDQLSHARDFMIRFDALNALAMCMVIEQLDGQPAGRRPRPRMNAPMASTMRRILVTLGKQMPTDPAAGQMLSMFGGPEPEETFRWDLLVDPPEGPPVRPPPRSRWPSYFEQGGMRAGRPAGQPSGQLPAGVGRSAIPRPDSRRPTGSRR